jgi:hypothetical protein
VVGQSNLSGHHNLHFIIHLLVLLLVFSFSETVVRKQYLQQAMGLVRGTKWQENKAIVF